MGKKRVTDKEIIEKFNKWFFTSLTDSDYNFMNKIDHGGIDKSQREMGLAFAAGFRLSKRPSRAKARGKG